MPLELLLLEAELLLSLVADAAAGEAAAEASNLEPSGNFEAEGEAGFEASFVAAAGATSEGAAAFTFHSKPRASRASTRCGWPFT